MPNGIPPDPRAERLELVNSALRGPLAQIVGYAMGDTPAEDIAAIMAAMAWKIADDIMLEIDALPP